VHHQSSGALIRRRHGEHQEARNGQWRAPYRDEGGREHSRHFTRKVDAQRWLDETTASVRVIPLPTVVVGGLAAHLAAFPAVDLILTNEAGDMIGRSNFGTMWRRATKSVELDGLHFHDLRHYYASLLIRHGESVKTVQALLGHANAAETLDTYSHLWPDSDDHTREAVDLVLTGFLADSLRTSDIAER